jgi:hypothetical protein
MPFTTSSSPNTASTDKLLFTGNPNACPAIQDDTIKQNAKINFHNTNKPLWQWEPNDISHSAMEQQAAKNKQDLQRQNQQDILTNLQHPQISITHTDPNTSQYSCITQANFTLNQTTALTHIPLSSLQTSTSLSKSFSPSVKKNDLFPP